jgi:hypothetical protein
MVRKRMFQSSAPAPECGRWSTSTTLRARRFSPWNVAGQGIYNIVDDDPAPASVWLPALQSDRRKPPRHLPAWIG